MIIRRKILIRNDFGPLDLYKGMVVMKDDFFILYLRDDTYVRLKRDIFFLFIYKYFKHNKYKKHA